MILFQALIFVAVFEPPRTHKFSDPERRPHLLSSEIRASLQQFLLQEIASIECPP